MNPQIPSSVPSPACFVKRKKNLLYLGPQGRIGTTRNRKKRRAGVDALPLQAQAASLLPVRRRWSGQGLQCRGLLWSAAVGISWSSESGIWGPGVEHRWRTLGLELGNADRRRALYCLAWATTPATLEALELSNFSKQTTAR